jgi:hypothetical protein
MTGKNKSEGGNRWLGVVLTAIAVDDRVQCSETSAQIQKQVISFTELLGKLDTIA